MKKLLFTMAKNFTHPIIIDYFNKDVANGLFEKIADRIINNTALNPVMNKVFPNGINLTNWKKLKIKYMTKYVAYIIGTGHRYEKRIHSISRMLEVEVDRYIEFSIIRYRGSNKTNEHEYMLVMKILDKELKAINPGCGSWYRACEKEINSVKDLNVPARQWNNYYSEFNQNSMSFEDFCVGPLATSMQHKDNILAIEGYLERMKTLAIAMQKYL